MQELHAALLALQELDREIAVAESKREEYSPRLAELDGPVLSIERELEATRRRLDEMRAEVQRLERNAEQKRDRLKAYEERLARARTSREEAAVRTELDLVRRALEADVADVKQTAEQATRLDLKLDDLQRQADRARADAAPQREQLMQARAEVETQIAQLKDRRENQAVRLDPQSRRLYERLLSSRSRMVLAPLTGEGACGNCFNVLPVQEQSVVRRATALHRCEACGVILYTQ